MYEGSLPPPECGVGIDCVVVVLVSMCLVEVVLDAIGVEDGRAFGDVDGVGSPLRAPPAGVPATALLDAWGLHRPALLLRRSILTGSARTVLFTTTGTGTGSAAAASARTAGARARWAKRGVVRAEIETARTSRTMHLGKVSILTGFWRGKGIVE